MEKIKYKCCATIYFGTLGMHHKPCSKTAKFERDGARYCGTHDPVSVSARNKQRDAEYKRKWEAERQEKAANAAAAAEQKRRADLYDEMLNSLIACTTDEGPEQGELNRARAVIAKATGASHERF